VRTAERGMRSLIPPSYGCGNQGLGGVGVGRWGLAQRRLVRVKPTALTA